MSLRSALRLTPRADLAPLPVAPENGAFYLPFTVQQSLAVCQQENSASLQRLCENYFFLGGLPPARVLRMAAILRK